MIPCFAPIIWFLVAFLMLLKWIFVDGWFIWVSIICVCAILYVYKKIKNGYALFEYSKRRNQNLQDLYNKLSNNYKLKNIKEDEAIKVKIQMALESIIKRLSCNKEVIKKFNDVKHEFFDCTSFATSQVFIGKASPELDLIKGKKLKVIQTGWPNVIVGCEAFTLRWNQGAIYCYPYFCIYESKDSIDLFNWESVHISHTNGEPSYHTYLHTRIDGGPDRRYSYNPSIPVYLKSDLIIKINNTEINIIVDGEKVAENTSNVFHSFQNAIKKHGVQIASDISDIDVSSDELASLIREICNERGSGIMKEKLFISILADYKVFEEKYYLRSLIKTINNENLMDEIINNPTIDSINSVKRKLIKNQNYTESQINETLAYICYGLGIN